MGVFTFIPGKHGKEGGSSMNGTEKVILVIAAAAAVTLLSWPFMAVPEMQNMLMDHHNPGEFVGAEQGSENSRLIVQLQQSVDILDRRVNEALERAKYRMRTQRFIPVVVTAYNPVASQTDSTPEITASNKRVRPGMVALSRDLEEEFGFKFGDPVFIVGLGFFVFEDRMHKRWARRVDILMPSRRDAKKFGVKYSFLLVGKSGVTSSSVI